MLTKFGYPTDIPELILARNMKYDFRQNLIPRPGGGLHPLTAFYGINDKEYNDLV